MSEQKTKKSGGLSRRDFLKLMGAAGTGLAFAPFVPFGNFMPNPSQATLEKVKVILPDGTQANVKTFPINHSEVITYPSTGDPALDAEAFRKWQFIRLPQELGGDKQDVSSFRAYSMFVFIFGVCGNIGLKKDEREENVLVMEVCMTLQLEQHLLDLHHYKLHRLTH